MKSMNKTDIILQVSENTGVAYGDCDAICRAFEKQNGAVLLGKLRGNGFDAAVAAPGIAETTGYPPETCEKVLQALQQVIDEGIDKKLHPFRHER